MTSLGDVYEGDVGSVADPARRRLGTGLFLLGALLVVAAIALATTGLRSALGFDLYAAREVAGVLAGVGVPAVFVGIFAVLPASSGVRAVAAIGASLAVLGVTLFTYAYPDRWLAVDPALTVSAILVYGVGTLMTVWCLFAALVTFKSRNDPGGTARVAITEEGRVRVVERDDGSSIPGFGSVGLFGNDPDGSVQTQTNRPTVGSSGGTGGSSTHSTTGASGSASGAGVGSGAVPDDGGAEVLSGGSTGSSDASKSGGSRSSGNGGSGPGPHPQATSDGGTKTASAPAPLGTGRGEPDPYCGNCQHFEYRRAGDDLAPYCGFHGELMEDMDACPEWESNS